MTVLGARVGRMGQPVAKEGDRVTATDTHIVLVPSPAGPVPTPLPSPFVGVIDGALSPTVKADDKPVATDGSTATNQPAHVPAGGSFQVPPSNRATILAPAGSVFADGRVLAKNGDTAMTCNDPADLPIGKVIAVSTVLVG